MSHVSNRRSRKAAALIGVLALGSLGLAACGDDDGGSGSAEDGPIMIGTSLPLTGEFSQPGQAAEQGYQVWKEMVNESGGLLGRDVDLVIKDDASNQNTIVSDYNALISQDKVDMLLGTFSSLLNLPASAVAEKNRMLFVEPAGGSPDMFNRGYEYLFFAQQATSDKQGKVFAEWVAALPEGERPETAAFPTLDDPFAAPNVAGIQAILEEAGIETVYEETYAIDTKNFDTIVNAMKSADPDLVVHGAQFEDGIGLTRSMLKADFAPEMFYETNAPSFGSQYADGVGADNTEGVLYAVSHSPNADTPGNAEFVAKYEEMYGSEEVPEDAADGYAAAQVMQAAVEAIGNVEDQDAMADWLRENEVETILGPLSWNEDGSPTGEFLIGQWQDGQPEIVLPPDAATSDIELGWKPGGAG
ncbi:branched-chain amino acid transport system substrate-binding protein [Nocardioides salarius]|uniref:Branched-chain amino acid transport system substrate-binding protein n=1 Tax=Nocardioides salarius TaxID=374513 RepID=A0ABS2MBG1_9ACTN|nr:amino acid ABC transporter substrate-binding protein [Nocardioides salarius]MBM7508541.1 branched-chain amino acid transport system substrate-binding protein [Nocardioides salarius]